MWGSFLVSKRYICSAVICSILRKTARICSRWRVSLSWCFERCSCSTLISLRCLLIEAYICGGKVNVLKTKQSTGSRGTLHLAGLACERVAPSSEQAALVDWLLTRRL